MQPSQFTGMDIFNIAVGTCSIISLFVSLWANSKVNKINQRVTGNSNTTVGCG